MTNESDGLAITYIYWSTSCSKSDLLVIGSIKKPLDFGEGFLWHFVRLTDLKILEDKNTDNRDVGIMIDYSASRLILWGTSLDCFSHKIRNQPSAKNPKEKIETSVNVAQMTATNGQPKKLPSQLLCAHSNRNRTSHATRWRSWTMLHVATYI